MGSNGLPIPHNSTTIRGLGGKPSILVAPGTGGGCIVSGPFANATVNLGPIGLDPQGPNNGLGYNLRCITRDINLNYSNQTKASDVLRLITNCNRSLECFHNIMEDARGIHGGGHFTTGGLGLDAWASPGDPMFYLHHAAVDWVWSLWQGLDQRGRTGLVFGTQTAFNGECDPSLRLLFLHFGRLKKIDMLTMDFFGADAVPTSPNVTLDTELDCFGVLAPPQRYGDLDSTVDGPFCYAYV